MRVTVYAARTVTTAYRTPAGEIRTRRASVTVCTGCGRTPGAHAPTCRHRAH